MSGDGDAFGSPQRARRDASLRDMSSRRHSTSHLLGLLGASLRLAPPHATPLGLELSMVKQMPTLATTKTSLAL